MKRLGKLWWVLFNGAITVFGVAYLALSQAGVWWVPVLAAIALSLAAAIFGWPVLARWINIVREKHPALIARAVTLEQDLKECRAQWERERVARPEDFERGRREGARAVIGSLLAMAIREPVELTGKNIEQGELVLYAESASKVDPPARFYVEQIIGGARKGVVEVFESAADGPIRLKVVEPTVEEYWV